LRADPGHAQTADFSQVYLYNLLVHGPGSLVKKKNAKIFATLILFD